MEGSHNPADEPLSLDEEAKRPRYRILLVDDDPATLMAMKRHLLRMRGPVAYQGGCPCAWLRLDADAAAQ